MPALGLSAVPSPMKKRRMPPGCGACCRAAARASGSFGSPVPAAADGAASVELLPSSRRASAIAAQPHGAAPPPPGPNHEIRSAPRTEPVDAAGCGPAAIAEAAACRVGEVTFVVGPAAGSFTRSAVVGLAAIAGPGEPAVAEELWSRVAVGSRSADADRGSASDGDSETMAEVSMPARAAEPVMLRAAVFDVATGASSPAAGEDLPNRDCPVIGVAGEAVPAGPATPVVARSRDRVRCAAGDFSPEFPRASADPADSVGSANANGSGPNTEPIPNATASMPTRPTERRLVEFRSVGHRARSNFVG